MHVPEMPSKFVPEVSNSNNLYKENCTYVDWREQILRQRDIVSFDTWDLIQTQLDAARNERIPKIASDQIKAIEIVESDEELVDIRDRPNPRIQMLPDPLVTFGSPECNSGFKEVSKVRKSVYESLEKMVEEFDRIGSRFGFQKGQISLRVFEGLRSVSTQKRLFDEQCVKVKEAHPNFDESEVIAEASKYVSPVKGNVPAHSTGGAIDLRLYDEKNKKLLDMGVFGVIWESNTKSQTFSQGINSQQLLNRLMLYIAASNSGLVNYPYEYWHFSTKDRYACYYLGLIHSKNLPDVKAEYGSIE